MKIWVFGDSYSKKFEDKYGWDKKYTQLKGYFPKTFSELISNDLQIELKNYAEYGNCNNDIFHSIVNVIYEIKKNDLVFIQWANTKRFRLVDKSGEFRTIQFGWDREYDFFNEKKETINEILSNRESANYFNEIDDWTKIINLALPKRKIIFWSPLTENVINFHHFTTIAEETNFEINDQHYGEVGHQELANYFLKLLTNKKTIL
jgi:hypothetical protein